MEYTVFTLFFRENRKKNPFFRHWPRFHSSKHVSQPTSGYNISGYKCLLFFQFLNKLVSLETAAFHIVSFDVLYIYHLFSFTDDFFSLFVFCYLTYFHHPTRKSLSSSFWGNKKKLYSLALQLFSEQRGLTRTKKQADKQTNTDIIWLSSHAELPRACVRAQF